MTKHMIEMAGFYCPSYPFDDIFCSTSIVKDCLDNGFGPFLDFNAMYMVGNNDENWVPISYSGRFGQDILVAHHDIRSESSRSKFRRRVERFLRIGPADNPLFVMIHYAARVTGSDLVELRRSLDRKYAGCAFLVILYGAPEETERFKQFEAPGLIIRSHHNISGIVGVHFTDISENLNVSGIIRSVFEETSMAGPVGANCRSPAIKSGQFRRA